MVETCVHQLVHGYRRGHEQLAGSVSLDPKDADLVVRLTDLSGTLTSEADFEPYLTVYPLPSRLFYALGKTWLDRSASRSGCVLTHTILIPADLWIACTEPSSYARLLRLPSRENLEDFVSPISKGFEPARRAQCMPEPEGALEFVTKYFGEGLWPIVWFGQPHAEDIVWQILSSVWPKLRLHFAACTLALQPRTLDDRPFDLMFAPPETYSRFHKLGREHLLQGTAGATASGCAPPEPWCREWASTIFGSMAAPSRGPMQSLLDHLDEQPTAIRRVFLIQDLKKRANSTPVAAAAIMDVVESIAPGAESIPEYKEQTAKEAIRSATLTPDAAEALRALLLIEDRLSRPAFAVIRSRVWKTMCSATAGVAVKAPDAALEAGESFLLQETDELDSAFGSGVMEALRRLADIAPDRLWVLQHYPNAGPCIIRREPKIALACLQGADSSPNSLRKTVADWISAIQDKLGLEALRNALLPGLRRDEDTPIIAELIRGIDESSVDEVLTVLSASSGAFSREAVRRLAVDRIARVFPEAVHRWADSQTPFPFGVAVVVAATYSQDLKGLGDLLGTRREASSQASVLAAFLRLIAPGRFPEWLSRFGKQDPTLLTALLAAGRDMDESILKEVERVLDQVRDAPLASAPTSADVINNVVGLHFWPALRHAVMTGAISSFVQGRISEETCRAWFSQPWADGWIDVVENWELRSLLTHVSHDSKDAWKISWRWLATAPPALYRRVPAVLPEMLDALLTGYRLPWTESSCASWVRVIQRASSEGTPSTHLALCVQALKCAFDHDSWPLSSAVVSSFWPVYEAVTRRPETVSITDYLFRGYSWDRGEELRRRLVDYYYDSVRPPGDLALAARDVQLLRKIFRRVWRKWHGQFYIEKMLKDLEGRRAPEVNEIRNRLLEMYRSPDFYEEWD